MISQWILSQTRLDLTPVRRIYRAVENIREVTKLGVHAKLVRNLPLPITPTVCFIFWNFS